jgi:hypothetical protein
VRYYRKGWIPPFNRVLLVESGSRWLIEKLLPAIYRQHGPDTPVDVVTCYAGVPSGLNLHTGKVYWVTDYGPQDRNRLLGELLERRYTVVGIVCSAEPIMTKWKWWLTYRIPAKVFVINENCDYFYVDLPNWRIILHFTLVRAGLTGPQAVQTVARLVLFPFTLAYLTAYAGWVHLRRRLRLALGR